MQRRVELGKPCEEHLYGCKCCAECVGWLEFEQGLIVRFSDLDIVYGKNMARKIAIEHRRIVGRGRFLKQSEQDRKLAELEAEPEYIDMSSMANFLFRKYGIDEQSVALADLKLAVGD